MAEATSAAAAVSREGISTVGETPLFAPHSRAAGLFKLGHEAPVCDLIMKGGVTSGVVYPYAVLRLAQKFRFAGIGGTSAGAMAAALAAAAEYARTGRHDASAYSRFEAQCFRLPDLLAKLFQPHDQHRSIFKLGQALMELMDKSTRGAQWWRALGRLVANPIALWILLAPVIGGVIASSRYLHYYGQAQAYVGAVVGFGSGLALLSLIIVALNLRSQIPLFVFLLVTGLCAWIAFAAPLGSLWAAVMPAMFGGAFGLVGMVGFIGNRVIGQLKETDFGLCSGLKRDDSDDPGVTDWLHAAIQDVAGLPLNQPLTFGDIENVKPAKGPPLALRMITTNMTLRRPHALPDLAGAESPVGWIPKEWRRLFPDEVVDFMTAKDPRLQDDQARPLPQAADLPVVVGARMSLSFPVLFSAVRVYAMSRTGRTKKDLMLLIDGGLSSNMPLHFFDSLGPPAYPTFAFNLADDASLGPRPKPDLPTRLRRMRDALRRRGLRAVGEGAFWRLLWVRRPAPPHVPEARRISLHSPRRGRTPSLPALPTPTFFAYLNGLLGAAKDWQDNLLSIMPGQFDRIVRIRLAPGEGGLNLVMPQARSKLLMRLGYRAGAELAINFDLNAHRVRRALTAYHEIERVAERFTLNWSAAKLDVALRRAPAPKDSIGAWAGVEKDIIIDRFRDLAVWAAGLDPKLRGQHFPKPRGSLRITPNLSGDAFD